MRASSCSRDSPSASTAWLVKRFHSSGASCRSMSVRTMLSASVKKPKLFFVLEYACARAYSSLFTSPSAALTDAGTPSR